MNVLTIQNGITFLTSLRSLVTRPNRLGQRLRINRRPAKTCGYIMRKDFLNYYTPDTKEV